MPEINEKYIEYLVGRGLVGADIDLNKTLNDEAYRNDLFSKIQTKTNNIYGSIDQFNHDLYGSGDNEFTKNRYIVGGSQSALRAKNKERAFPGVGGTTPLTTDIKPVVAPSQGEESQMRGGINEFSSALEQKAKGLNQKDKADVKEFEGLANLELQSASQQFETIYPQSEDIFNKATKLQMDAVSKRKELEDLLTSPEATAKQEEISRLRKSIESNNNEYARITKSTEYLEKQDEIHKLTSEAKSVNESLLATKGKISEQFGNDWEDKIISVAPIISEFSELMIKSDLTNDVTEKKILESEANRFIEENKDAITYFNDVVGNPLYKEYQSQADIYNKTTSDFDQRIKQKTSELYTRFPQLNELTQKDRQLRSRYQQVQKAYNSTIGAKQEKYGKELAKLKKQFEEINPTLTAIYESPEYADLQRAKEYSDTAKKAIEIAAPSDYSKMLEKRQQTTDLENRLPTQESLQRINPVTNSVVGAVSNFLGSIAQGSIATTSTVLDATLDGLGADDLRTWVRNGSYEALSGIDASINYLDAATRPSNQRRVYAEKIKINDNLFAVVDGNNVQAFTDKEGYDVKGDEKSYKQAQKLLKEGAKPKGEIDISSAAWETLNQATMMASYLYGGIGMSSVFGKLGALSRSSNLTRLGLSMAGENAITSGIGMQVFSQSLARGILDNKDPLENVTNATIGAALEMTLGKALGNVESKVSKMYLNKGSIDNFLSLSTSRKILLNKGLSTKQKIKEIGSLMAKDLPNGVKEAFLENVEELGIDPLTQAGTSAIFGGDVSLPSFSESMNIVIPTTLMVAGGDAVGLGGKYRMLNKGAALASIYSQIPNKLDPSSITDFFNQGMGKLTEGLSEEDLKKLPNIDEISKETSGLFNKVEEYKQENNLIDEDFDALRLGTLFNLLAAKSRVESLADDATDIGEQEKYTGDLETIDAELTKLAKDIENAPPTSEGLTPKESAFNPDRIAIEKSKEKDTTVAEINATTEEDYTDAINKAIEKETDPFATLEDEVKTETITDKEPTQKTSDAEVITQQEAVKETPKIEAAVIEVDGKLYEGKNHAEAILKAQADGKDISQVNRQEQGKFRLSDGTIIDRAEAKKQFGQDRSELIIPQDDASKQANKDYAKVVKEQEQSKEEPIAEQQGKQKRVTEDIKQQKTKEDGIQKQESDESVFRTEQSKVGLQEMGKGDTKQEGVAKESKEKDLAKQLQLQDAVNSGVENMWKLTQDESFKANEDTDSGDGVITHEEMATAFLYRYKKGAEGLSIEGSSVVFRNKEGSPVGFAHFDKDGIREIGVDKSERGNGIASKMIDYLKLEKGIDKVLPPFSKEGNIVSHRNEVKKAIAYGKYQKAISNGDMTAQDAKNIIESAGLEVPKEIESILSKEQTPKEESNTKKVTPVKQGGKLIIDENGNLTDELPSQFEKLKNDKDLDGLNDLYSTVNIFLNGVAQSKGENTVKQFQKLKKELEDFRDNEQIGDSEISATELVTKIPINSKTIRGMFVDPSNWDNNETLSWGDWINKISKVNATIIDEGKFRFGDYSFSSTKSPTYENKYSLIPKGYSVKYMLKIANKNQIIIPSQVYKYAKAKADGSNPELVEAVEDLLKETKPTISKEQQPTDVSKVEGSGVGGDVETKQQIENFGVNKADVEPVHSVISQVFSGLKKAGLTAAKTVGDWVGIGKGEANPNSLDGIVEEIKKTLPKVEKKETAKEQPKTESEIPTWVAEFERTKNENDLVKMEELYNKIKVVQNGVLQGRIKDPIVLEKTVKELNDLKKQIEDYAENRKKENQPKVSAVTETDTKKQPINKIEDLQDVGEKIGGAKKDLAQKLSEVTTEDLATKPLSKVFPKPDFKKLVEEGSLSEDGAILLNFLYEKIPAKPRKQYRVANWVKTVDGALQTTRQVLEAESTKNLDFTDKILKAVTLSETLKRDYKLYSDTMKGLGFPKNDVNLGGYEIKKFENRSKFNKETQKLEPVKGEVYSIVSGSSIIGDFKTMDDAINGLKTILNKSEEKTKGTKFDIYQDKKTKEFFIGKKGAIDVVRVMQGFKTLGEARTFLKEKQADIQGLWDAMKAPKERRMANRPRVGADWRKGKNVDSKEFADTFGFRGVEFGNWVNNAERQSHVNEAYDALMDLSSVLGISPKALSLNGELGFAFGARGSGKANAHYEAGKVVINLTKTRGAGSLAHEWWHAMDNYFSRNRGQKESFITQNTLDRIERDGSRNQGVRKEMIDAFKSVMDTIKGTKLSERSKVLDRARSDAYWSTNIEMSARSFENYIIEKLGERNQQNDYLANFKETAEWINDTKGDIDALKNYPYPLAEESPIVNEKFQQFFETIKEDESNKLFKDAEAQYRIESGKNIIEAIKDFNKSKNKARATVALIHEIMHPTVVAIIDGAKDGNEVGGKHTETIVNEFNKANPNNKVTVLELITGNENFKEGNTGKQYRAVQEFIAKSWEQYHTEGGKGFSESFQKVLDQITKAFQSVYKSITGKELTPELKQMFDDILGKEQSLPTQEVKDNTKPTISKEQQPTVDSNSEVDALKDVESTAKALEGVDKEKGRSLFEFGKRIYDSIFNDLDTKENEIMAFLKLDEKQRDKQLQLEKGKLDKLQRQYDRKQLTTEADINALEKQKEKVELIDKLLESQKGAIADIDNQLSNYALEKYPSIFTKKGSYPFYIAKGYDNIKTNIISEAYHKAKEDGSNPELVKAVESLLSKEQAQAKKDISEQQVKEDEEVYSSTTDGDYKSNDNLQQGRDRGDGISSFIIAAWDKYKQIKFNGSTRVKNAADVAHIMRVLEDMSLEHAFAVHVDRKGKSHIQYLSSGSAVGTVMDSKQVLAGVAKFKSKKVYLVHNHPTGNLSPSKADTTITDKVRNGLTPLGISVEHIIMDTYSNKYVHIDYSGDVSVKDRDKSKTDGKNIAPLTISKQEVLSEPTTKVVDSKSVATFIQQLRFTAMPKNAMLVLDTANRVIGNYVFQDGISYSEATNFFGLHPMATSIIFYGNQRNDDNVNSIKKQLSNLDINVLDHVTVNSDGDSISGFYDSMADKGMLNEDNKKYGTNSVNINKNEDDFVSSPKVNTDEKGNIILERLRKEEEQGRSQSGETNALATIVLSRLHKSVIGLHGENSQQYQSISNEEEAYLEDFSKQKGIWVEEADKKLGNFFDSGQEQRVYIDTKNTKVVNKISDGSLEPNWLEFLDRIALHNANFGEGTAYTLKGFGRDSDGRFVAILEQPYITPRQTTEENIAEDMSKRGFVPLSKYDDSVIGTIEENRSFINKETGVIVEDLHLKNVFDDGNGNLVYIDPVISLDKADRGYGGVRETALPDLDYTDNKTQQSKLAKGTQTQFSSDNSVGKETTTPQDKKEVSKIIEFFNKMFGFDGFAPFSEFAKKLKELGYDSLQAMVDAWHGSPHSFKKFTTDKIGTGEGAQAFGWGLYFTDLESIGRNYAKNLAIQNLDQINNQIKTAIKKLNIKSNLPVDYNWGVLSDILLSNDLDIQKTITFYNDNIAKYTNKYNNLKDKTNSKYIIDLIKSEQEELKVLISLNKKNFIIEQPSRNLYKVSLHKGKTPSEYNWLEWDKPLNEKQKQVIKNIYDDFTNRETDFKRASALSRIFETEGYQNKTGEEIYNDIIKQVTYQRSQLEGKFGSDVWGSADKIASLILLEAGIDGIKYPAESIARGTNSDNARGFNYVVFDENAVTIEEKIQFLKTPSGKVLGFVADGKIYLNPNALTAETAFHELHHVQQALIKIASQQGDKIAKAVLERWDRLMKDNDVAGQVKGFAKTNTPLQAQIIGEKGASKLDNAEMVLADLSVAREMEKAGKDAKTIWTATSWQKGVDGKWRFEVPDVRIETSLKGDEKYNLSDIYKNSDLYKAYPQLAKLKILFNSKYKKGDGAYFGGDSINLPYINIGNDSIDRRDVKEVYTSMALNLENFLKDNPNGNQYNTVEQIKAKINEYNNKAENGVSVAEYQSDVNTILIHEIQHAIQDIEGFAIGGTENDFIDNKIDLYINSYEKRHNELLSKNENELSGIEKRELVRLDSYKEDVIKDIEANAKVGTQTKNAYYQRLAGEAEARNAQTRATMTIEERKAKMLSETEDVAREDQIVLMSAIDDTAPKRVIKIKEDGVTHEIDLSASVYNQGVNESDAEYEERIRNEVWSYIIAPENAKKWDLANKGSRISNFINAVANFFKEKLGLKDMTVDEILNSDLKTLIERTANGLMKGEWFKIKAEGVKSGATAVSVDGNNQGDNKTKTTDDFSTTEKDVQYINDGESIPATDNNIGEVNKIADKTLPKSGAMVFKNVLSKVLAIGSALGNPVIIHTGHDAMIKFLKDNGDRAVGKINDGVFGYFDGTNYHVVLSENMNLGKTQYDVLLHEFLHPYISSVLANNPQHFNALVTELLSYETLKKKYFDEFANPYDNRKKLEEALIEYLKDVSSSKINEKTIKAKGGFINAVKGFFKKLTGAKDIETKVLYNTDMDLSSFANSLINAIVNTDTEYFKDLVNTKTQRELLTENDNLFNRLNDRLKAAVKNNRYLTFAAALRTGLINEEIPLDYDKIMEHPTWGNIFKLYNISPLVYENLLTIYNDDDVTKAVLEKVRANEVKKRDKVISDVTDVATDVKDSSEVEIEHKPIVLGDTAIKIIDKLPTELQDKLKQAYTTRYAEATPLNFKEFLFPLIEKLADLFNGGDGTNPLSFEKMTLPQINNLIEGFSGLHNSLDIDQQVYALNYALKVAIMELTLRLDEKMYKDDKEKDDISRLIEDYTIRLSRQTTIASYVLAGVKNDMLPNRYKHLSLVSDIYDALLQGFSDFKGAKKTMDDIVGAFKEAKRQMAEEVKNQYKNQNNKGKPKEQKPKEQKPPTDKKGKKDTPDRIKELADMIKAKKATESLSMTDYDKAEIELLHLLYTSTPLAAIEAAYNNLTSSTNGKAILDEYLKTIDNSIQEYYAGTTNATLRDTLSKNGIPLSIVGDVATLIESAHKDLKSLLREKVYQTNAKKITKIVIDKAKQLITDKLKDISNYTIHKAINKVYNTNVFDDYKADLLKSLGYIKASNTTVLNNLKKKRVILLNKQNPQSNRTKAEINKLDEEIKLKESIIAKADDTIQRITDSKNLNEINSIVSSIANEVKDITETSNRENARIYKTATETIKNAGLTESDILTELEQDGFSEASILSILSAAMGQKVPSKKVMVSISKAIDEIKTSSSPAHQKTVIRKINHILNESKITYSQQLIKRFFNHMTNSLYNSVLGIKSGVTAFLSIVTNNTTYAIASALAKQWSKIKKDNRETIKIIDEALKDKSIYPPPELMDRFVYAPIQGLLYLAGVSKLMPNYVSFKPITDYSEALKPILSEYVSEESFGDEKSLGTWIKDVYEEVKNREGFDKTKPIAEAVIETVAGILSTVMETPTRLLSLMNHVGITMFRNSFFRQSLYSNPLVTSAIKEIKDNEARVKFIQDLVAVDKTTKDEIEAQVNNEIQANNIPHWSRGVYKAQRTAELRESVILENEIGESVLQSVRANIALNGAQDLSVGKTAVAFEKFWQWVSKSKLVKYNYESKDAEDYNILDKIEDNIKQLVSSAVSFVVNGMLLFPLLSVRIFEGVKNTIPILGTVPLLLDFTQAINTGTYKRTTFIQGKDPITGQRSNEKTKQTFDVNLLSGDFINRVLLQVIGFSIATPLLSSFLSVTDDDEEKTFIMIDGAEAKMPMRFGETDAGFYFFTGEDKELKITRNNKDFVANSIMYYDKKTGKVSNEIPFRYKLLNTVIRNSLYNYMAQFAGDINNKSVFTKEYKRNILYNADTTEGQELLFKDRLSILPKDKSMVGINPNEGKITKDGHISANVVSFATNLLSSLYASTFSLMSDNIENTIENFSHLFDVATSNVDPDKNRDDGYTKFGTDEYYDRLSDDLIRQYGNGFQFMPKSVMKDLYGLKGIQYPNLKAMDFGDKFFNNITEPLRPFMRLSPDEVIYDTNIFGDVTLNNIPLFGQLGFKINPFIKNTNTGIIPKYKYDSDETRLFEAYVLDDYGNNVLIKNKRISRDNVINFLNYLSDTPIKVLNEALDHHNKKNYLSQLPIYIPNDLKPSYTTLAADEGDLIKTIPSNLRANYLKNYPVYAKAAAADEVYNSLFHIRKVELLPETDMRQTYFNKFATQTDMAETFSGNASSVKSEASKLAKLDMFYNIIADNGIMAKAVLSDRYEPIKRRNKLTDRQLTEYMLYGLNNSPLNLTEEEKKEFGDNEYIENFTGIKALNNFLKTHQVKINKNNITFLKQPKGKELINQEVISNPIYKTYPPVLIGVDFKKMEERLNVLSENMEYVKKTIEY